ncbi:MAG: hypothetical protein KBT02_07740 [Treponema sp.]|nr:hypothetical protein [Candidatus Treponema caballi]
MMKRTLACFLILALISFVFAEEEIDEFDLLFEEAVEDIVVEEAPVPVVEETVSASSASNSVPQIISFSGSFSGNAGGMGTWEKGDLGGGGVLTFDNTLYMTAKPASDFIIHASINTTESNLDLNLISFYFDYLWKSLYVSAGKKTLSWGNIRMFSTDTYGTVKTNLLSDFGPLVGELQFPFLGSWTIAGSGTIYTDHLDFHSMKYAASYENVFQNTNTTLYGTYTEGSEAAALELKRTIGGFDFYGQAIGRFSDVAFAEAVGTAGFYRLWETDGPDYGINVEYQFVYEKFQDNPEIHKIALETGIKQMGKHRNLKLGTQWGHNFTDGTGFANIAFLIGDIFPHANWTNVLNVTYDRGFTNPEVKLGLVVSLSIDY